MPYNGDPYSRHKRNRVPSRMPRNDFTAMQNQGGILSIQIDTIKTANT
jgi:hypothetical protein